MDYEYEDKMHADSLGDEMALNRAKAELGNPVDATCRDCGEQWDTRHEQDRKKNGDDAKCYMRKYEDPNYPEFINEIPY